MIESVGEAGMIVEQGNAQALADAMREMKSNEEAYRRYRERAENRAEVFSYRRYRKRIREIFGTGENEFK
jgi:glycosyltransferase involved in cell wall biosynthesis